MHIDDERFAACIPTLNRALAGWAVSSIAAPPNHMVIAAATPKDALVLHASHWPRMNEAAIARLSEADVVATVAHAIESKSFEGDTILQGTAALLGRAGVATVKADAAAMRRPVTVVLVASHKAAPAWSVTVVELPVH